MKIIINFRGDDRMKVKESFRMTKPREVVLSVLNNSSGHLTAEEVFEIARKLYPGIGFASVYRSLKLFEKNGIVESVSITGKKKRRYQLKKKPQIAKIHLVCTNCSDIKDFSEDSKEVQKFLKEIKELLSKKYNFKLSSFEMQIFGKCEDCENGGDR
jgi:Fur family ferric uptake transcriptional regulator